MSGIVFGAICFGGGIIAAAIFAKVYVWYQAYRFWSDR